MRRKLMVGLVGVASLLATAVLADAGLNPAQAAGREPLDQVGTIFPAEGTFLACLFASVGQGLTLADAAKTCGVTIEAIPGSGDLPGAESGSLAMNGMRNTNGPMSVSCPASGGVDPQLASEAALAKAARDQAQAALNAYDRARPNPDGREAARRAELSLALNQAQQKLNDATTASDAQRQADAAETKKMLEGAASPPKSAPEVEPVPTVAPTVPPATAPPPTTPTPTTHPVSGVDQACSAFAAFVGECNLAGWATSPCQQLRRQLRGCPDSTVSYVTDDDPDAMCQAAKADTATVARVVELHCNAKAKIAPGYDPCAPPAFGGGPGGHRDPTTDPCTGTNLWALTTADGCEVTVNDSPDFGLGPKIDPTVVLLLGGPGIPTAPSVPTSGR